MIIERELFMKVKRNKQKMKEKEEKTMNKD